MRKITLALLIGSLAAIQPHASATQLVADASTNFEPARKTGAPEAPAPASQPKSTVATSTAAPSAADATAQEEVLRRQAAQIESRKLIDEGQKQYYDGKYEAAIVTLEKALKILPRAKATEIDYSRAVHSLSDSYAKLADAAFNANDSAKARSLAQKSLEYEAHNKTAENVIIKVKRTEYQGRPTGAASVSAPAAGESTSPAKTPEFLAKRDEVRRLFREGKILLNSGQFDEAEKRFQQVLLVDPYNTDAYELLNTVTQRREPSTVEGREAGRAHMIWQADHAWTPPISGEVKQPDLSSDGRQMTGKTAASTELLKKLTNIVFPEIKFREATITDVVTYLHDESVKLDSTHEGVNIVLGSGVGGEAAPTTAPATPEAGNSAAAPAPASSGGPRPITLSLRNVPMIEALKYITSLANLKYRIESSAVLIVGANEPEGQMVTRTYPVTPGAFSQITTPTTGGSSASASRGGGDIVRIGEGSGATAGQQDVKVLFEGAGVPFPAGSSIHYNERTSTLIVKNTSDNIELLERVLPAFIDVPKQVEIEAKFVEVSQSDLDELGFNWQVGQHQFGGSSGTFSVNGGTPATIFPGTTPNPSASSDVTTGLRGGSAISGNAIDALLGVASGGATGGQIGTLKGILTDPQFQLIITALSQKKSQDVLSAPKVTTISGVQAQIKVVQEFIYPTEYSEPQTGNGGITPSVPSSFKTREVGVVLNVTPTVGADNYTINLTLIPEVSEFLGFLDYSPGNVTSIVESNSLGNAFLQSVPMKIQQPLFSSRNLTTSVVLWDGQTVVLGGMIREDVQKIDDKVPFLGDIPLLGRLFRSKVTVRDKRNLLIFVTARLIDPAGNPIHKDTRVTGH